MHFCDRCLNGFIIPAKLVAHMEYCMRKNDCAIEMPIKGETDLLKFKDFHKKMPAPFIVYADLEALLKEPTTQFSRSERTVAYRSMKYIV